MGKTITFYGKIEMILYSMIEMFVFVLYNDLELTIKKCNPAHFVLLSNQFLLK